MNVCLSIYECENRPLYSYPRLGLAVQGQLPSFLGLFFRVLSVFLVPVRSASHKILEISFQIISNRTRFLMSIASSATSLSRFY